jgi:photosystem II PsbM protein
MQTNNLGFVASLLFILVPSIFLIILFIQTNTRGTGSD